MGFEFCHPAVNFIFFAAVIWGAVSFDHPLFLAAAFISACAYSIKKHGWKSLFFALALLPFITLFAFYYSSYHHFGITVLRSNFVGNNMTLEAVVYGFVLGICAATLLLWLSCLFKIVTTDKIVYLFGKISPRLSLFLTIILRLWPRIKAEARKINTARQGIGKGISQGSGIQKLLNTMSIFSMLISWIIGALATVSVSMKSRGSTLKGRTAYSIYRFDNRDRSFVICQFFCLTLIAMAVILKFTTMVYDPKIIWKEPTALLMIFCIAYMLFCLMPLMLELWTEYQFRKARNQAWNKL